MIKLLIIDDEKFIRQGLITTIKWDELGIKVVDEAENGKKALDKIKKLKPEIIICDVKMPVMDGLEVARYIYENELNIKIIILSGYDEFKYAQEAVKYGVKEYLLKPAGEENLIKSIVNIKNEIEKEKKELENRNNMHAKLNAAVPVSRGNYLRDILYGYINDFKCIDENFELLDINLESQLFTVIKLMIIKNENFNSDIEYKKMKKQIIAIVKYHINRDYKIQEVNILGSNVVFIINRPSNIEIQEFIKSLKKKSERITEEVKKKFNIKCYIGIGHNYISADKIKKSFNEALIAASCAKKDNSNIAYFGDFKFDKNINNIPVLYKNKEFELTLLGGNIEKVNEMISSIMAPYVDDINNYKKIAIQLIIVAEKVMYEFVKNESYKYYIESIDYLELVNLDEIIYVDKYLKDNINKIVNFIINNKNGGNVRLIKSALEYIKKHYNEKASVRDAADKLGLNADYFSYLFKKEIGKNFIDVLNEYRIEKAKEYLKSTNYKIYEIAYMVGFNDNRYFSTLFKKFTGYTPSQFSKNKFNKEL